jgi:translation initiation factor IF-1
VDGEVLESYKSGMYRIALDNGHEALGYTAGKMRRYRIKILIGDRIKLELSPYDLDPRADRLPLPRVGRKRRAAARLGGMRF